MIENQGHIILSIDTATRGCTVSLTKGGLIDGEVIGLQVLNNDLTHSRRLLTTIDDVMVKAGLTWPQIEAVAVGLGPGSFTGLRIGMATAKGLVTSADIPLLGVSTLDALAACCCTDSSLQVCSVIDARKKEVYAAFYDCRADGRLARDGDILAISPSMLAGCIKEKVILVGDGVITYRVQLQEMLGEKAIFAPVHLHVPNASVIGFLAHEQMLNPSKASSESLAPLYVRASDAELSLGKRIMD